ncbi:MAG: archease [Thermoplasmata archaeon]|nr:archease [Thermoplasmata archaeon]
MMTAFQPDLKGTAYEDHTADIWLVGYGDSPGVVLSRMVNGLYGAVADRFEVQKGERTGVVLEANSLDLILVDLISEALYLLDAERIILTDIRVDLSGDGPYRLALDAVKCRCEIPEGAEGLEIKAATYHGAYLKTVAGGWEGRILLDI